MGPRRRTCATGRRWRRSARPWWTLLVVGVAAGLAWVLQQGAANLLAAGWLVRPSGETCRVQRVLDGDSLRVLCAGGPLEVRLYCIDAPEREQVPWAKQSRRKLRELASSQVDLVELETDRFGRRVAEVYGRGPGRPLLNLEQVRSGNAAVYRHYCDDPRYERAEQEAREAGLGIWSSAGEQQTPWRFRHRGGP